MTDRTTGIFYRKEIVVYDPKNLAKFERIGGLAPDV